MQFYLRKTVKYDINHILEKIKKEGVLVLYL